jgi:ergothioneine biosynthesis protein EgtB
MTSRSVLPAPADRALDPLLARYLQVRGCSLALAAPISAEDAMVQSMPDASPAKWHLAHTTWFFERFVLARRPGYRPLDPRWDVLFNSYYQGAGPMHARPQRGLLSRPSLQQVLDYRDAIDARVAARCEAGDLDADDAQVLLLGTHHEQQHQELLLTDIQHAFSCNPLQPAYRADLPQVADVASPLGWRRFDDAVVEIGAPRWPHADAFAYDNESPRHRVLVAAHALAQRPVSNGEFRAFIDDGGYADPSLWLSDGWDCVQRLEWSRPLYWNADGETAFTLAGVRPLAAHAPVCHLSYFEADAFARWAGARLPTEFEWEQAATAAACDGNLLDANPLESVLQPQATGSADGVVQQLFGDVWEWTASAYTGYPGFRPLAGTLGEYNGKFMSGAFVLRGGSCATPRDHVRASYRNFFGPSARWQFAGLRLARDA